MNPCRNGTVLAALVLFLHAPAPGGSGQDTIPSDFPTFQVLVNDNPAPGLLFLSPVVRTTPRYSYITLLDAALTPVYHRRSTNAQSTFTLQPNGLLTFYEAERAAFFALDASYAIVDSFRCGNGYTTDGHDFQLRPDGHAFLMAYDTRIVDMSAVVPGGNPAASVTGLILQELDPAKNVVFQWSSWDHFAITDATHQDLTGAVIDYVHGNAFDRDTDGHILLSSRHMDEITKINRQTGAIIWRLGGRNNQFTFLNDSLRFSHQHDVRRLPNGNILLFDNGNFHVPQFSRVVEYRLDESLMTAELVWEYRHSPPIFAPATGSAQRLPNGNTLISWGSTNRIMEVRPDGSRALDMLLAPTFRTYRTQRYPWTPTPVAAEGALPETARLLPAFPNPFNAGTRISYVLPRSGNALITLWDMLGRRVAVLLEGRVEAGAGSVMLDAGTLASGVYVLRLEIAGQSAVGKVLLLR